MSGYLLAFLLTVAVEPPLCALALRGDRRRGYLAALLGNATSHPLTWLVLYPALPERWAPVAVLVVVEAFAVAWEAVLLRLLLRRDRAFVLGLSLVVNAVSLAVGALVLR